MLSELRLTNFRCFKDHSIPLRRNTVLVGKNNAGKSTVIDALRLVSLITNRYGTLNFSAPPRELDLPLYARGMKRSLDDLGLGFTQVFHQYSEPPATIEARFEAGQRIAIHLPSSSSMFALITDAKGHMVRSKSQADAANLPNVEILPIVAPLSRSEVGLSERYVRGTMFTHLAPAHFRNQLILFRDKFPALRRMAEDTWPGLQLKELAGSLNTGDELFLSVRDGDFVGEIATMGHGLQMWLQTMWFLTRVEAGATVILDEPDVYMHPDLQRRLIRLIRNRYAQSIVATHSIEIMSEVPPDEILVIDRARKTSRYADSHPSIQRLVDNIGSVHNIHLARLSAARKCLLVEGKDVQFLGRIDALLYPESIVPVASMPSMPLGGWGGWSLGLGIGRFLQESGVKVYCILDRDFHLGDEIQERISQADDAGIHLHVWTCKEIENLFLSPKVIQRVIANRIADDRTAPREQEVATQLNTIAEGMYNAVTDSFAESFRLRDKRLDVKTAMTKARCLVDPIWQTPEGRLRLVSGKEMFAQMAAWCAANFGVSLGVVTCVREFRAEEVPLELRDVLDAIEQGKGFN